MSKCSTLLQTHPLSHGVIKCLPSTLTRRLSDFPAELLGEIFNWTCRNGAHEPIVTPHSRDGWSQHIALMHTCRRWKAVALHCSSLWTRIDVDFSLARNVSQKEVTRLAFVLGLSAHWPLRISITDSEDDSSSDASRTKPRSYLSLASVLFPTSHRWKELAISFDYVDHPPALFLPLRGRLQILEQLQLCVDFRCSSGDEDLVASVFLDTPCLQTLDIGSGPCDSIKFEFPWSQIRTLEYVVGGPLPIEQLRVILAQGDNLTSLLLAYYRTTPLLKQVAPLVVASRSLKSLEIVHVDIMNHLTIPTLENLTVSMLPEKPTERCFQPLIAFIQRSQCKLQSLELADFDKPILNRALPFLQVIPTLKSLHVKPRSEHFSGEGLLLELFLQLSGDVLVLPQLENLIIATVNITVPPMNRDICNVTMEAMEAMVDKRRGTIRSLTLDLSRCPTHNYAPGEDGSLNPVMERLFAMQGGGFKMVLDVADSGQGVYE